MAKKGAGGCSPNRIFSRCSERIDFEAVHLPTYQWINPSSDPPLLASHAKVIQEHAHNVVDLWFWRYPRIEGIASTRIESIGKTMRILSGSHSGPQIKMFPVL